ncbi:MAG: site-specific integrase [Candidatus Omnitrophica bacterium]|nr:site-specific integrase [Candidatus Omnitrophota bacterium]
MGRILEINGEYYVEFFGNGLRFQKNAGKSYEAAVEKLKSIELSLETSALKYDPFTLTVDMFYERYLSFCEQVHPPKTFKRFKSALNHFRQFLDQHISKNRFLREITPRSIELYKQNLIKQFPRREYLINFTLYLVRDILQYTITLGWLNDNPTLHTPFLKDYKKRIPLFYAEDEIEKIDTKLNDEQRMIFRFLLCSGLTIEELSRLKWEHVNVQARTIDVETFIQNTSYARIIPMDYQLLEIVKNIEKRNEQFVFDHPSLPAYINRRRIRNTFVKRLLEKGVSLSQLYKLIGLNDIAKIFRYHVFLP